MTQFHFGRRTLVLAPLAALAMLAGLACYLLLPSGYLAIDLNPSVEITTNRLNQVVTIKGVNADARALLEGYHPTENDLEDIVEELVDRMAQQGYLKDAAQNDILITVGSSSASKKALERVNKTITSYLEERRIGARVLDQTLTVSKELRELAERYGVSAGRMAVIETLFGHEDAKTVGDLAGMRVSDLLDYAREKGITTVQLEQAFDDLDELYERDIFDRLEEEFDSLSDKKTEAVKPEWDALWNSNLWNDGAWTGTQGDWDTRLTEFLNGRHADWDDAEDYFEAIHGDAKWDQVEDALEAQYGDDWDDRYDRDDRDDDRDDRYDDDHDDHDDRDDDWDDRDDD